VTTVLRIRNQQIATVLGFNDAIDQTSVRALVIVSPAPQDSRPRDAHRRAWMYSSIEANRPEGMPSSSEIETTWGFPPAFPVTSRDWAYAQARSVEGAGRVTRAAASARRQPSLRHAAEDGGRNHARAMIIARGRYKP